MSQATKSMALYFLITCTAVGATEPEQRGSLTNLVNYLIKAETVTLASPTNAANELAWLAGKWECCDRALRVLPSFDWQFKTPTPTSDYPWLETIEITGGELRASATNADFLKISLRCSFYRRPEHFRAAEKEAFGDTENQAVDFELAGRNLKYRNKPAHLFWLKRERAAQPQWMLLEKQDTGELLFFRRAETPPATTTKGAKSNSR